MTAIHPTAIVDKKANIGTGVAIGPYCVVGRNVTLGDDTKLHSHVVVEGHTTIGPRARIFPFASIGHEPQDLKYAGEESRLEIGSDNLIREYVTVNPGTAGGGMVTRIGDRCAFLACAHVGHDTTIGDEVVLSNNVMLAGHCGIGDYVIFGGGAALHQFGRVGKHAFIGGMSAVENDVIPFGLVIGNRAYLTGLNIIGLKRRGYDNDRIQSMRKAYAAIFSDDDTFRGRVEKVGNQYADNRDVMDIVEFIQAESSRAICMPKTARTG